MHDVECLECSRPVFAGAWFDHVCFTHRRRNVWRTPRYSAPFCRATCISNFSQNEVALPGSKLTILRLWNSSTSSFKHRPVEAAASVGLRMGYKCFAIPSCGSGARALIAWCNAHDVAAEIWVPRSVTVPGGLTGARIIDTDLPWQQTYELFWARCSRQSAVYPVFPSGDPWFLAVLRVVARRVIEAGYDRIVIPCASGIHFLSYVEELEVGRPAVATVGVQLAGHDPLVRAWEGRTPERIPDTRCPIASMSSERPVNQDRIVATSKRVPHARLVAVSLAELRRAHARYRNFIEKECRWCVDHSLYACLAFCLRDTGTEQMRTCVLSTAGSARSMAVRTAEPRI